MWDIVVAAIQGLNDYLDAQCRCEWPRDHANIIDWIVRRRLGIPHVPEDIT